MTRPLTPTSQNDDIHSLSTTQPLEPFTPALFDFLFQRVANKIKFVADNAGTSAASAAATTYPPGYSREIVNKRSTSFVSSTGAPTTTF
jgi:hypothetical protein